MNGENETTLPEQSCDVLVIGGGPAGSTIGALLAERGWRVVVLEKDRHPRFHIGESLVPHNNPLFERLGILKEVEAIGLAKPGAEFNSKYHGRRQTFYFAQALDESLPMGFEVHRAELDELLIRTCAAKGATVHQETRAVRVEFERAGVVVDAKGPAGEMRWRARFLVDATGRDTFVASLKQAKQPNRKHASAAIYGHYRGAKRLEGVDEGNISIYWFDHGWMWFIPLTHGITSVGAVCWPYYLKERKGSLDDFLDATVANCPELAARLADASRIAPVTATGNYSYEAEHAYGRNYIMVGDAYAFIDPIFSSGVYLAMASSFEGADAVDTALRDPARATRALRAYERRIRHGIRTFSWFIYRITTPAMRDLMMYPEDVAGVVRGMISFLAGDVFRPGRVRRRIAIFKGIYYIRSLWGLRESWQATRRRRANIRPVASS